MSTGISTWLYRRGRGRIDSTVRSRILSTSVPMSEAAGEPNDLLALFDRYKERLRRVVRLRLDPRLTGFVDSSGVLKMARDEVDRRVADPGGSMELSFLWLRQIVG